jgi:putative methionine-R-sulfoxide reductase with GAF domain
VETSDAHRQIHPQDLTDTFAQVARVLLGEHDVATMLDRMSALAVETIDGAQHCGVTVVEVHEVRTAGASDDIPRRVDQIQYDTGQGPCLQAIQDHEVFETGDIAADERWPSFAARAVEETGIRSVLAFRLYCAEHTMGALNLYSRDVNGFDDEDRHVGSVFAAHAAVALSNARQVGNLERALETRDVIATAKGLLMARSDISDDQAFDILRRASQRTNVKLRVIAQGLVDHEPWQEGTGR